MKVLVGCEFSGRVRSAFRARGHDAWSCDLLPTEDGSPHHLQMDVRSALGTQQWDLLIVHPPCTHLAASGRASFHFKVREQAEALDFIRELLAAPVLFLALENPVGVISKAIRPPDQIIQPWQFGHRETKTTCLWLMNLPRLVPTNIVGGFECKIHRLGESKDRWKIRSRTYQGIADAMAEQWGAIG